jgi:hypothetical protein
MLLLLKMAVILYYHLCAKLLELCMVTLVGKHLHTFRQLFFHLYRGCF